MDVSSIKIESISTDEYFNIINKLKYYVPVWIDPRFIKCYKEKEIIIAKKGSEILAVYVLPIYKKDGKVWVKREYRYFPYLSPIFFKELDTLHYKEVCLEIFSYVFNKCDLMCMPMHPLFKCVSAIQGLDGFVECRHTHILKEKLTLEKLNSKMRNHIKHAMQSVKIVIDKDVEKFNFDISIKGNIDEKTKRAESAKNIINQNQAIVISAMENEKCVAGIILTYDRDWSYLLHSWQNEDAPRGTVALLIYKAIEWSFDKAKVKYFDFEGSVIQNIDNFFSSFNAEIITYPYIHFAKNSSDFEKIINISKNIEGRKIVSN